MFTRIGVTNHQKPNRREISQAQLLTFKIHVRYVEAHVGQKAAETQQEEGRRSEETHVQHSRQSPPDSLGAEGALTRLLLQHVVEGGQVCHCHRILKPAVLSGEIQKETL